MKRARYSWANTPAQAAELRKRLGLAIRRAPGPLPRAEQRAYAKVVLGSELAPAEHVDALLGALIDAFPDASLLDVCSWFDPGIVARETGTLGACSIIAGENENDPGAAPTAPGLAGNVGGSQQ